MRILVDGDAKVIIDVVVEIESAPALRHDILAFAVEDLYSHRVAYHTYERHLKEFGISQIAKAR